MRTLDIKPEAGGQTLATNIANSLRAQIAGGDIAPGEKLRLDELRTAYGVSLSPLREALSRLSAEGFVTAEDQRGYRVAPVSRKNLSEVTRLRAELEPFALRLAIRQGGDAWEGRVVASLHRLNKLERARDTHVPEWEGAHRELHQAIVDACDMPLLLQFCATLHDLSDRYRRLFLSHHPIDRDVADEHERICRATLARDADQACYLLRSHIERTAANVQQVLEARAG